MTNRFGISTLALALAATACGVPEQQSRRP